MLIASGPAPPSDPAAAVAATAMIAPKTRTRCFAISFFAFPSIACRIERARRSGGFPARRHAPIRRRPDRESEPLLPKTKYFSRKKRKPYLRRIARVTMRFVRYIGLLQQFRAFIASWSDGFIFGRPPAKRSRRTFGPAGCVLGFDQKSIRACRRRRTSE